MKRILRILLVIAGWMPLCISSWQVCAQTDSLDLMLDNYLQALEFESMEVKNSECDFLIGTCTSPEIRSRVALRIYDHYLHSPQMGVEEVAVHIYDRWFVSGEVEVPEDVLFGARIFADFNRQSLLGRKAPQLVMPGVDGDSVAVFPENGVPGRYKVLYFYDTDCPKCFIETTKMPYLLKEDFPIDLYAIYVGGDAESWEKYRKKFSTTGLGLENTAVTDLWDPEVASDYQRKYGVVQTPRLFLVDNLGIIRGRGLDVPTLTAMLHHFLDEREMEYGSEQSVEVFDKTFEPYGKDIARKDIAFVADYIAASTLETGDTLTFKQLTGDLLYYLIPQKGREWKAGLEYVINRHVFGQDKVWTTADDSLKVVGTARMMDELLGLSPEGSRLPALRVPGILYRAGKGGAIRSREGVFNMRKMGGRMNLIIFYTAGCEYCRAEKEAAAELLAREKSRGLRVLEINLDEVLDSDPELADCLLSTFDLTALPFLMETDRKGYVKGKYLTLVREK